MVRRRRCRRCSPASVMLASERNLSSMRASSAGSFRSAGSTSTERCVSLVMRRASASSRSRLRATENQVVAAACQPVCVRGADACGGAGDEGGAQ